MQFLTSSVCDEQSVSGRKLPGPELLILGRQSKKAKRQKGSESHCKIAEQ